MLATRSTLAKTLGLLGSTHAGEVLAAAAAAELLRRQLGLSWIDLISAAPSQHGKATPQPERQSAAPENWRATVAELRSRSATLDAWEVRFLASLESYRQVSPKQLRMLGLIAERIRAQAS